MKIKTQKNKSYQNLYRAFLTVQNEKECEKFLRDVCTISELKAMAERLEVAQLVDKGLTYRNINAKTGISTTTIARVSHWLHHGKGGYHIILNRLKRHRN